MGWSGWNKLHSVLQTVYHTSQACIPEGYKAFCMEGHASSGRNKSIITYIVTKINNFRLLKILIIYDNISTIIKLINKSEKSHKKLYDF